MQQYLYIYLHERNDADSILAAKSDFERFSSTSNVTIRRYHCDNGVFADNAFRAACEASSQRITFCGTNDHHQNGIAERHIRDLRDIARSMLLYAQHHWPKVITPNLWGFALKYASILKQHTIHHKRKHSPLQLFSGIFDAHELPHFHTFGCPTYCLDTNLQAGNPQPNKWMDRSRLGIYLGASQEHATSVSLVLNPNTGLVSPQFHIIHDDSFSSVNNDPLMQTAHKWRDITRINRVVGKRLLPLRSGTQHRVQPEHIPLTNEIEPVFQRELTSPPVTLNQHDSKSSSQREQPQPTSKLQREQPQPTSDELVHGEDPPNQSQKASFEREACAYKTNSSTAKCYKTNSNTTKRASIRTTKTNSPFSSVTSHYIQCSRAHSLFKYNTKMARIAHANELRNDCIDNNPLSFASTLADADTMYLHQAKRQPDWQQFKDAMKEEIVAHTKNKHWTIISRSQVPKNRKIMRAVWSMKRKRRMGTGEIYKWKA